MSYYLHKPSLSQDTNRKLHMIRKNLLHDVLVYNQQSSQNRRQQKKFNHSRQVNEMNKIIDQQYQNIRRQDEQNRLNVIRRRQMLRQQYERQIKQKLDRQQKQKQHDRVYAQIEKDYIDFRNQRRIQDIQRMFNRRTYKASINQGSNYNNPNEYGTSGERSYQNNRLKSEPSINYNPEMGYPYGKDYGYYAKQGTRDQQRQKIKTQNGNDGVVSSFNKFDNKNSLSNIQIRDPINKITTSNQKYNSASNQQNNFINNFKPQQKSSKNLDGHY